MTVPGRPTSLAERRERSQASGVAALREESLARGRAFRPRAGDLFITPFAKSGTTWLQQIVHTLRTGGDLDFDDISRVIPWIEWAHAQGIDLEAEQRGPFRAFKSHLGWHDIPGGGRYLLSLRDPGDVLLSFYRFFDGWQFEAGSVSLEDFAAAMFLAEPETGGYWQHLISWWPRRHDPEVLLLCYEEMRRDPGTAIDRIARFVGIDLDEDLKSLVLERSSLPFMLAHKDRFDDRLMRELLVRMGALPPGGDSAKVRSGEVGGHRSALSAELATRLDGVWAEQVTPALGLADYAELRAVLAAEAAAPG